MVTINGEKREADGLYVIEYLLEIGYCVDAVAVEVNGRIIAKEDFGKVRLADGDTVEVVRFVGGG